MKTRKSAMFRVCIPLVFFCANVLLAQQKNIFVSPAGNDENTGLGIGSPKKSINSALAIASAGDTLFLLPGTYSALVEVHDRSGTPEDPICIYGYPTTPGTRPTIDGGAMNPGLGLTQYWMDIRNSQWIEVGNLNFTHGWTDPIQVVNSSYLTFRECSFQGGRRVISASGEQTHHMLVEQCSWDQGGDFLWTYQNAQGIDASWAELHDGSMSYYNGSLVHFGGTGGSVVIRENVITNAFNGIRWSAQKGFDANVEIYDNVVSNIRDNDFEPEYFTYNLHIYHNISHNIHKTFSVDNVEGGYIYYYGNRITSDGDSYSKSISSGFWKVYGTDRILTYPLYAFNNSFCGVGKAFGSMGGKAAQLKHFNNAYLFTGTRGWELNEWDSTNVFDHDISNKPWAPLLTAQQQELHGKVDDVKYLNPATFDLRLQAGSPAIDAGTVVAFPELQWVQSYEGTAPDIGAFENGVLVDGPPFQFKLPPGRSVVYNEKPRIVASRIEGKSVSVYFSAELNPATVTGSSVRLTSGGIPVAIERVGFPGTGFELRIETDRTLDGKTLSIDFEPLPQGANGENVTFWASAIPRLRTVTGTGVGTFDKIASKQEKVNVSIYPNPSGKGARVDVVLPDRFVGCAQRIRIFDMLGRTVKEVMLEGTQRSISVQLRSGELPSGIYFIGLNVGGRFITQKFIVLK
jgi:hypothetical protein